MSGRTIANLIFDNRIERNEFRTGRILTARYMSARSNAITAVWTSMGNTKLIGLPSRRYMRYLQESNGIDEKAKRLKQIAIDRTSHSPSREKWCSVISAQPEDSSQPSTTYFLSVPNSGIPISIFILCVLPAQQQTAEGRVLINGLIVMWPPTWQFSR
jgi:hypothetical protein